MAQQGIQQATASGYVQPTALDPAAQGVNVQTQAAMAAAAQQQIAGAAGQAKDKAAGTGAASSSGTAAKDSAKAATATREEATTFRLVVNGEIESAHLGSGGRGALMCVFSVQHGADWSVVHGPTNGITQLACPALPATTMSRFFHGDPREAVWNFPIGMVFKSTSPFGWPRLVVAVYGTDFLNRRVIRGYGTVHIPCQPGRHVRVVRLYCPVASSALVRFLGFLAGNPAQFVDPRILAGTEGREVVRVQSGGKVRITFDVLLKDVEEFRFAF